MSEELEDCPFCPNQGWYAEGERHPIYDSDENGYPVLVGFHEEAVQVQCEFCWTNPLSKFYATNIACTGQETGAAKSDGESTPAVSCQ